jgi:hypothetical protein
MPGPGLTMTEGQPLFVQSTSRPRKTTRTGGFYESRGKSRNQLPVAALLSVSAFRISIVATLCSLIRFAGS